MENNLNFHANNKTVNLIRKGSRKKEIECEETDLRYHEIIDNCPILKPDENYKQMDLYDILVPMGRSREKP